MDNNKSENVVQKDVLKNILSRITEFTTGIKRNSHQSPSVGNNLLEWVLQDDDLRAGIEKKYSKIMDIGYFLRPKGGKTKVPEATYEKLVKIRFDEWYSDSWWQELIYFNSFTELGWDSSREVNSLSIIKTDEVEIVNTPYGKVINYLQIPTNNEESPNPHKVITLPADKVIHISFSRLSTSLWGSSVIDTLLPLLRKKRLVEDFIHWLFESNQFRSVIKVPSGVGADDVETYLEMLKTGMINPTNFLVLQGDEAEVTSLRAFEGFSELLRLLAYYQSKINKLLQLPPLEMGNVESSNRSSSEYQVRYAFYSHIRSLVSRKAEQINHELFPALGIKNVEFVPNLVDDIAKKDLLENAQKLLSMNANPEKLNRWLIDNGLNIPDDLFEKSVEEETPLELDKNSNQHPSRKPTEMNFAGGSRKK